MKAAFVCLIALVASVSAMSGPQQVVGLPGSEKITDTMYTGYVDINPEHNSNLFYWFMECRNNPETAPVLLWMTGGPGCSSELAVLFENGPFSVADDGMNLIPNPYSWNEVANVLYIDQPFPTGFSYTDGDQVRNETEMADDMFKFLNMWFGIEEFQQYAANDFFIAAESYGGHYAPALSRRLLEGIQAGNSSIKFSGTAIGNGWVDPYIQFGAYGPFAFINKLINESVAADIATKYEKCQQLLTKGKYLKASAKCEQTMSTVLEVAGNLNVYNIDLPCTGELCYNFTAQTVYMNNPATQAALGVNKKWETCTNSFITTKDSVSSFADDVAWSLDNGLRMMAYSGKLDLICNYVGGENWTHAMNWTGQSDFNAATYNNWTLNGDLAGEYKSSGLFTWMQVEGAGHMVPHDQPETAIAMIKAFIGNNAFPSSTSWSSSDSSSSGSGVIHFDN